MSDPLDSYSYARSSSDTLHHLPNSRSSRLRRRSLRVSLLLTQDGLPSIEDDNDESPDAVDNTSFAEPTLSQDDVASNASDNFLSDTSTILPRLRRSNTSNAPISRAASIAATATASPAKKTCSRGKSHGKKKKKVTSNTVAETLQGLGPIPPSEPDEAPAPQVFGSLLIKDSSQQREKGSTLWKYVYGLKSDQQPASYSLQNVPVLAKKPKFEDGIHFIGCRLCNAPVPPKTQSS